MTDNTQLDIRLHHVGFVVPDIREKIQEFARSLGATWDARLFDDPIQKVTVGFLQTPLPSDAQIELIQPAGQDSPVFNFLKKGGGLHHLCYEVGDLAAHLRRVRAEGALLLKPPVPAVAFGNRRIAWVSTRQKLLIEFLEQEMAGSVHDPS